LFASQLRLLLYNYCITETFDNPLGDLEANFLVGLFATPIEEDNLDLMAGFQKFCDLAKFDLQVMGTDLESETHLFHIKRFGGFTVFLQLLSALVVVFAPVDNFADWRIGVGRDFNQIKITLLRYLEGFLLTEDAQLFAIFINDPQLWCPNLFIQAGELGYDLFSDLNINNLMSCNSNR
jgi:hypothetical protein